MKLGIYKYVLGAVVMLAMSAQSNAIELKLSPGLQVSQTGEMVTLDLVVSGLDPISTLIGDFDVDIGFDDASLNFTGFSFSDALGSVISNDFFDPVSDAYDGDSGLVSSTEINLNLFSFLFESLPIKLMERASHYLCWSIKIGLPSGSVIIKLAGPLLFSPIIWPQSMPSALSIFCRYLTSM